MSPNWWLKMWFLTWMNEQQNDQPLIAHTWVYLYWKNSIRTDLIFNQKSDLIGRFCFWGFIVFPLFARLGDGLGDKLGDKLGDGLGDPFIG